MDVCVVGGAGYVGLVSGACLASLGHRVRCVDIDGTRIAELRAGRPPFFEAGLAELVERRREAGALIFGTSLAAGAEGARAVLLCVGTPASPDGSPDLSQVLAAAGELASLPGPRPLLAVKSTVPPGTSARLEGLYGGPVASCPEFLREGSAVRDFLHPDRIVFGVRTPADAETLEALHAGIQAPRLVTTPENAEAIKYASNALLAARVSLANELAEVCERLGADAVEVLRAVGRDSRIGPAFLQPGLGFGGPCLGKDLRALIHCARSSGYAAPLLQAVSDLNEARVAAVVARAASLAGDLRGRSVGVLGLAFKPGTGDARDSRSLPLVDALLAAGARVAVHDPHVPPEGVRLPPGVGRAGGVTALAEGADCLIVATAWEEYARLDWAAVARRMRRPCLVDGRDLLDPEAMAACGFAYAAVGRPRRGRDGSVPAGAGGAGLR